MEKEEGWGTGKGREREIHSFALKGNIPEKLFYETRAAQIC